MPRQLPGKPRTRQPPEPTAARPGTPEKIEVLAERARRRQPLFVAGDARVAARVAHRNAHREEPAFQEDRCVGEANRGRRRARPYAVRVWVPRLGAQLYLGVYRTQAEARAARDRARALLPPA